ncbi:pyruvate dehydrogenase (acetyl-transferring), homodimeric type, partial [Testudinibacter sp. TR-2022]
LMMEVVDGDYQTFKSKDGAYVRKHFFGRYPETEALVADMTDDEIWALNRGGHDPIKVFAAFNKAKQVQGKPVVLLVKTIKGYGMGDAAEGKNIAHQVKKMDMSGVRHVRDQFSIDLSDEEVEKLPYITFEKDSEEYKYLHEHRKALQGYVPTRSPRFTTELEVPELEEFAQLFEAQS